MLMLMLWPLAVTPGVTHFGAYHRPLAVIFDHIIIWMVNASKHMLLPVISSGSYGCIGVPWLYNIYMVKVSQKHICWWEKWVKEVSQKKCPKRGWKWLKISAVLHASLNFLREKKWDKMFLSREIKIFYLKLTFWEKKKWDKIILSREIKIFYLNLSAKWKVAPRYTHSCKKCFCLREPVFEAEFS